MVRPTLHEVAQVPVFVGQRIRASVSSTSDIRPYIRFDAPTSALENDCASGGEDLECFAHVPAGAAVAYVSVQGFVETADHDLSVELSEVGCEDASTGEDQGFIPRISAHSDLVAAVREEPLPTGPIFSTIVLTRPSDDTFGAPPTVAYAAEAGSRIHALQLSGERLLWLEANAEGDPADGCDGASLSLWIAPRSAGPGEAPTLVSTQDPAPTPEEQAARDTDVLRSMRPCPLLPAPHRLGHRPHALPPPDALTERDAMAGL